MRIKRQIDKDLLDKQREYVAEFNPRTWEEEKYGRIERMMTNGVIVCFGIIIIGFLVTIYFVGSRC